MTALEKKINTTIRLTADVKQYLDEMKGSVSASEFIETMLSYFERNGVDPRTSINGKFKTLELQGIERIIKIIRAIEKDKIDKLLPASESHSDDLLKQADKQVTQLKAEVERLKKASAPDVVGRNKLGQVVRLLENAFDQKNFKKAEKGTDYFVAPVYLEMLLYKVRKYAHKTGNGPSCTDSSEVEIQFEQRKYDIFFSQENIIWRQCGLCGRLATIKKRMAYSTIFPAILYRMKCPYSPANYLKGD